MSRRIQNGLVGVASASTYAKPHSPSVDSRDTLETLHREHILNTAFRMCWHERHFIENTFSTQNTSGEHISNTAFWRESLERTLSQHRILNVLTRETLCRHSIENTFSTPHYESDDMRLSIDTLETLYRELILNTAFWICWRESL